MAIPAPDHHADRLLQLQRTIGNQAVRRLAQTQAAQQSESVELSVSQRDEKRDAPPLSQPSVADRFESESPRLGAWTRSLLSASETKPADAAERSADAAADAAVRNERPTPTPSTTNAPEVGTPPWGSGRRLSLDERQWHEQRLGASLGDVRVHEGDVPERWARVLGARAFTLGRDVVIGSGEYVPDTNAGRRLMAHELSHVVAARGAAPLLARVALTAADFDALADSLHDAITTPTADEELIYVALQKLERDATAIASLQAAYRRRHSTALLTALASRLTGRSLAFARTLLGVRGGLAVGTTPPSAPASYEAAARAINAALVGATADAEGVYAALLPLGRDATRTATLKTTYMRLFTTDLEADLTTRLSGADSSYALYLLNAPGPASPHTPAIFSTQPGFGTPPTTAPPAVAGGAVSVGTQVPYQTTAGQTGSYGFGVGYSGALASDTRWLQFIEREIDYTPAGGGPPVPLDREITSGGGGNRYRLTTSSASPAWVVDSYSTSNPFFDETHGNDTWRDATSVSIYDAPAPRMADIRDLFTHGATTVTSRSHFDIYLIRDFSAIYHVEIQIVWTYTSLTSRTTNRTVLGTGQVSGLPTALKAALVARYPAYRYIR
jgi:hypothetical protein